MTNKNTKKSVLLSSVGLAALSLSGCANTAPVSTPVSTPVTKEVSTPTTTTISAPSYKDGTYTVLTKYNSPAGPEEMGLTVVLKNNIITDTTFEVRAAAKRSIQYQEAFAANYKTMVVGKDINTVHLDKVAGASLTPIGFNDAIAKIEAQAIFPPT